jgi:ABC-type antimicrobial peptide transport system permease subunit
LSALNFAEHKKTEIINMRKIRVGLIGGLVGGLSGGITAFAASRPASDFNWWVAFSVAFLAAPLGAVAALAVRRAIKSHKQTPS